MDPITGIVLAVVVSVVTDWWLFLRGRQEPPEQRHDVLTGDGGDECMEGSFD